MSTPPVKPPGSGHPLHQVEELSGGVGAEKPSAAAPEAVETQHETVQQATGTATPADPVRAIGDALRSGEIDTQRAVEMLVERALEREPSARLSGQERQQLESFLSKALQDDPTLAAIVKDLERQTG
jgi:hypothetical protein